MGRPRKQQAAESGDISKVNPVSVEVDGEEVEVAAGALQSVTTATPHPADESSAPGPYTDLDVNRPPVSTNRPDVPIAHSLVGGAGAPTGPPDYKPELGPDQDDTYGAEGALGDVKIVSGEERQKAEDA